MKRYLLCAFILMAGFLLFAGCGISDFSVPEDGKVGEIVSLDRLEAHFLDVGQGDAIFIYLPNRETMLIDAGSNAYGPMVVSYLQQRGINKIDYLIGTHPHEDHIGGMDEVIKRLEIGQVYLPKVLHNTKTYEALLASISAKGLKINAAKAGTQLIAEKDLQITFLSPAGTAYKNLNNWSIVTRIQHGAIAFLLTGDAEAEVEAEMLAAGKKLTTAKVLKVGHHGSRTSTTEPFLAAVDPEYAIISVGAGNDYAHPHTEVLTRLADIGAKVYRTDLDGTLVFFSDGQNLSLPEEVVDVGEAVNDAVDNATGIEPGRLIGNKRSKVFHLATCASLPEEKNRVYFTSRTQALEAGFTPCSHCQP